jgi:hypothetical protein
MEGKAMTTSGSDPRLILSVGPHCEDGCSLLRVETRCPFCAAVEVAHLTTDDLRVIEAHGRLCGPCYRGQEEVR